MINGTLCLLLGILLVFEPGTFRSAIDQLIDFLAADRSHLGLVVFVSALVEATFPITIAFPGSFIIVLAVISGMQDSDNFWLILSVGSLGIISGNILTIIWAALNRDSRKPVGSKLFARIGIWAAPFANLVPSVGATYAYVNARTNSPGRFRCICLQLLSTPMIVAGAIFVFGRLGTQIVDAGMEYSIFAGILLLLISCIEAYLFICNRQRISEQPKAS